MLVAEFELLRHVWFPVARLQDLAAGPVGAAILGTELVVYQGLHGVTVAGGWCPHRGMRLSMGAVVDGELECPYHGWRFASGSGRCTAVPSLPAHLPPTRVELTTLPASVAYGMVWSRLDEPYLPRLEAKELEPGPWEPVEGPEIFHYRAGNWSFALGEPFVINAGIRALSENFRDMSHFAFVHRKSMGPNLRREVEEYRVEKSGWTLGYTLSSHPEGLRADGEMPAGTARPGQTFADVAYGRTNTYNVVLPSSTYIVSAFPGGGRRMVAQFAVPHAADGETTRVFWMVGLDDEVRSRHGVTIKEAHDFDFQVFSEDIPIVENSWPREQPLDPRLQVHTRADAYSIAYRRLYTQLLEAFTAGAADGRRQPRRAPAARAAR